MRTVGVPNEAKFGDQVVLVFTDPHYVPVLINDFENVEIDIKDDTNARIPFLYGRSRLKLHFKPRNG